MNNPSNLSERGHYLAQFGEPLEPTGKLVPQENPWMTTVSARRVMDSLRGAGAEARFVGGCVRDAIAKRPVHDIDIATILPPEQVMERLRSADIRVVPTGIEHGTVTAVCEGEQYQITTLRHDLETDGRRAKVLYTDNWRADAARRDFTINTLSCTQAGDVYNPYHGIEDLAQGMIRFVGNPVERIEEDILRILRYFRFYAYYGTPPIDRESLVACRKFSPRLAGLSADRVRQELLKTLLCGDPAGICVLMRGERIFQHILPEAGDIGQVRLLQWLESDAIRIVSIQPDPIRRLAALVDVDANGAAKIADRLNFSNIDRDRLVRIAAPVWRPTPGVAEFEIERAVRRMSADIVRDLILLEWAKRLSLNPRQARGESEGWQDLVRFVDDYRPQSFPLRGRDVLDLGVAQGPDVSGLLRRVEEWWEEGGYSASREACLDRLQEEIDANG